MTLKEALVPPSRIAGRFCFLNGLGLTHVAAIRWRSLMTLFKASKSWVEHKAIENHRLLPPMIDYYVYINTWKWHMSIMCIYMYVYDIYIYNISLVVFQFFKQIHVLPPITTKPPVGPWWNPAPWRRVEIRWVVCDWVVFSGGSLAL